MPTVDFSKMAKGSFDIAEGADTFLITKIEGIPRAAVTNVKAEFVNGAGAKLKNGYDLTNPGGAFAFRSLVEGCGFELDESFDINNILNCFVELDIVHKPREKGGVFNNIGGTLGVGTPFAVEGAETPADDEDEEV